MRFRCFLLPAAAACGYSCAAPAVEAPSAQRLAERCPDPGHNRVFIQPSTNVFRQGSTVRIEPKFDRMPAGYETIEPACAVDWRIRGPARLARDNGSFLIAPDAPVGSEIVVSYRWRDERAEASYRVVARDAVVLTGIRGQRGIEACEGMEPVRELEFAPGDRFSVTFMPFETYKDYWGTYSYDPATGALRMQVEGGNNVPVGLDLEGKATLGTDGRLILEDMYLGTPAGRTAPQGAHDTASRSCRYTF